MSKIKEVLRLKFDCHLPNWSIAVCLNVGCSTISDIVTRFRGSQLVWPLPEDVTELRLEALLYAGHPNDINKRMPDLSELEHHLQFLHPCEQKLQCAAWNISIKVILGLLHGDGE
ncbi:hypothetical protein [Serratia quinivorans]|uniref:hypothetical protein n=1 Tax=Serratia quinivorans TaxID=137545 RepID=UPI002E78FEF5|nr:hypothetical protein [Serratia quinivorans]